jgi:hypothetical protein
VLSRLLSSKEPPPSSAPAAGAGSAAAAGPSASGPRHARSGSGSDWSVSSDDLCGVCFDRPNSLHVQGCGHLLCVPCYRRVLRASASGSGGGAPSCPFCRGRIDGFEYAGWVQRAAEQHLVIGAGGAGAAGAAGL